MTSLINEGIYTMIPDVSDTIHAALLSFGIPQERINKFDQHSSLEISFKNIDPIFITMKNNMVWMWSDVKLLNGSNINFHARALLDVLQHALSWVVTGQAILGKGDSGYEIKALLDEEFIGSPEKLCLALNEFYSLIRDIHIKITS
ncbi:hypothetical protein [Chromobacterium violaceum]|uniref:InvB/SpaK family type III secretion system chaperone n=1 Tax=Chromobacterium violaceum TaxID=536 RepID=UPI000AB07332|nr:hypothetical protein [Chromobacterium violaceum]